MTELVMINCCFSLFSRLTLLSYIGRAMVNKTTLLAHCERPISSNHTTLSTGGLDLKAKGVGRV
jgi:hypothetical protein